MVMKQVTNPESALRKRTRVVSIRQNKNSNRTDKAAAAADTQPSQGTVAHTYCAVSVSTIIKSMKLSCSQRAAYLSSERPTSAAIMISDNTEATAARRTIISQKKFNAAQVRT